MSHSFGSASPIPEREVNAGLFTGAPFNGPWGNLPVEPKLTAMAENLKSANPPPGITMFLTGGIRPGNNTSDTNAAIVTATNCNK